MSLLADRRTMAVVEIAEHGGPEVLRPAQRPIPTPAPDEVLIRVQGAGVNRPDLMQREGRYPPPAGASDILGLEIAGVVVAVGARTASPAVGDRVCALVTGGGYAQFCTAAASLCLPVPDGLSPIEAASLPEALFTVWHNVFERGALRTGERLLVHGGTSGIGVAAIQCAREFNATVYATAGSAGKCLFCEQLGAIAINYREQDFVQEIARLTGGLGVDVILDIVGSDYLQRNLSCLAPDGRLVQIAVQQGSKATIDLLPVMLKRLTITGSTLRARPVAEKARIAVALRQKIWPLLEAGTIKPAVYRTFSLNDAAEAHRLMASSHHIGKIVLEVSPA